jgi:hypothetical protein
VIKLGNGMCMLNVHDGGKAIGIRGLNPNPERHPVLPQLHRGCTVGIFNVMVKGENSFVETLCTTIYVLEP